MKNNFLIILMFAISSSFSFDQQSTISPQPSSQNQEVEMSDFMRENGKIYVLTTIILIILFGLLGYLIIIDRKVMRLQKKNKNKKE